MRDGARFRLYRVNYDTLAREVIALPPVRSGFNNSSVAIDGVMFSLSGWTTVTQHYLVAAGDKAVRTTPLQPAKCRRRHAGCVEPR